MHQIDGKVYRNLTEKFIAFIHVATYFCDWLFGSLAPLLLRVRVPRLFLAEICSVNGERRRWQSF